MARLAGGKKVVVCVTVVQVRVRLVRVRARVRVRVRVRVRARVRARVRVQLRLQRALRRLPRAMAAEQPLPFLLEPLRALVLQRRHRLAQHRRARADDREPRVRLRG